MTGPQASWLPDSRRLHLNHGPIDLIVEAFGAPDEKRLAYGQAVARFETILTELVAGSVADEILSALLDGRVLDKAYVNNGGDIALHLASGQSMSATVAGTGHGFGDRLTVRAADPVRGIATSGWRGRSFSLGIADAVTVLARTAAEADAAATIIANAVDLPGHPAITRVPASSLAPDSDLGERLVTTDVGILTADEIARALESGVTVAEALRREGKIAAAAIFLAGESRATGPLALSAIEEKPTRMLAHA